MDIKHRLTLVKTLPALIAFFCSTGVSAQEAPKRALEEIIVTAQKRTENLQQVPLSVATMSGERMQSAGINNLQDLSIHMPSIHFTETGVSTQVRVRGIGSGNSQGFEQSVGMYIDGIHYGRAKLFRVPMMDMQRAELLRGPQSTLFGKNSIAGALNLTTATPTEERQARLALTQEFEFNTTEINGMLSGALSENLQGRLAVRNLSDDGYVYNSYLDKDHGGRDETSLRLSFSWQPSDQLDLYIKGEQNRFETLGRAVEITHDAPIDAGGTTYSEGLRALSQPGFEAERDHVRQANLEETSENTINNLTLKADYALGENTLTWVSGWLNFDYEEICDCDFVAAEILPLMLEEEYQQQSHELRLSSPMAAQFEWLGGIFYQQYNQDFVDQINLLDNNFLVASYPELNNSSMLREFSQNSSAWAVFGRVTWHPSDSWHLTVGARYTEENKDAQKSMNVLDLATGDFTDDPFTAFRYMNRFLTENEQARYFPDSNTDPSEWQPILHSGHNVEGERNETAFTPLLNVEYDFNGNIMAYGSFTTGFKAGGFDPRSNSVGLFDQRAINPAAPAPPNTDPEPLKHFEFDEEKATAVELGMKNTLMDGRGELNFAVYRTMYEDLQIAQFDGGVGFNVGNAKETQVQGLEVDGRWLLADSLTMNYGFAYLDFVYKDFDNGNCYVGQEKNANGLCDYTGKRGTNTPKYTINLAFDYLRPINGALDFNAMLDWQFVDGHQVHVNLDPAGEIDSYNMLGLRFGIVAEHWSLAILGKNLLDEYVVSYSADAPLADKSPFMANTHYSMVNRPRTIALEASIKL